VPLTCTCPVFPLQEVAVAFNIDDHAATSMTWSFMEQCVQYSFDCLDILYQEAGKVRVRSRPVQVQAA
jgi:hypothetical protein